MTGVHLASSSTVCVARENGAKPLLERVDCYLLAAAAGATYHQAAFLVPLAKYAYDEAGRYVIRYWVGRQTMLTVPLHKERGQASPASPIWD
jgi:hypothetical protein